MIKAILKVFAVAFLIFFISFVLFVVNIRWELPLPKGLKCDTIAVFTGDRDRIKVAMELIDTVHANTVFISGVYKNSTIYSILPNQDDLLSKDISVVLGYEARNTAGNAQELRDFVEDMNIDEVVLVTSDYHMGRSIREVEKCCKNLKIYPVKVRSKFTRRFLKLCCKEFYGYVGSFIKNIFNLSEKK